MLGRTTCCTGRTSIGPPSRQTLTRPHGGTANPRRGRRSQTFSPERETYLNGESSEWLLPLKVEVGPTRENGTLAVVLGPWAPSTLRKLKADIQKRSGVVFPRLKTFRATFGQAALDAGAEIEEVSRALRHSTTSVTETFYARRKTDVSLKAISGGLTRVIESGDPERKGYHPEETPERHEFEYDLTSVARSATDSGTPVTLQIEVTYHSITGGFYRHLRKLLGLRRGPHGGFIFDQSVGLPGEDPLRPLAA